MKRKILSVFAGLVAGIVIVMIGDFSAHAVFTTPDDIDFNDKEAVKAMMDAIPAAMYLMMLTSWCLSSFTGGFIAGKINPANWKIVSLITGTILMCAAVSNMIMLPHPLWMKVSTVVLYLPCAYAGGLIAVKIAARKSLNATCVLITKEKEYPKEILDKLPHFEEMLIETDCKSIHRRYEIALKARNELIYFQDDDCLIDVHRLYWNYNGKLTNALTKHHFNFYKNKGVSLIGFGCFFPKKMIDFSPYLSKFGVTPLFLREADRVFTYLNQPHNPVIMPVNSMSKAVDQDRMSMQPEHWDNMAKIIEQLQSLENISTAKKIKLSG